MTRTIVAFAWCTVLLLISINIYRNAHMLKVPCFSNSWLVKNGIPSERNPQEYRHDWVPNIPVPSLLSFETYSSGGKVYNSQWIFQKDQFLECSCENQCILKEFHLDSLSAILRTRMDWTAKFLRFKIAFELKTLNLKTWKKNYDINERHAWPLLRQLKGQALQQALKQWTGAYIGNIDSFRWRLESIGPGQSLEKFLQNNLYENSQCSL